MELVIGCEVATCEDYLAGNLVTVDPEYDVEDYELPCGHEPKLSYAICDIELPVEITLENAAIWDNWLDELEDSQFDFGTASEFADNLSEEIDPEGDLLSRMEDAFVGQYYDEATFAEQQVRELIYDADQLPAIIANHIDWQAVWDCELRHYYYVIGIDLFFENN